MERLKNIICSTINPFKKGVNKDALLNLTGKQASDSAERFLLNV